MFMMNEAYFAQIQRECCWFTAGFYEKLPEVDPNANIIKDELWKNDDLIQRHIFAMAFGSFGYPVDLSMAKSIAFMKFGQLENCCPEDQSTDNPAFVTWLNLYAKYSILLGTVFAYQHHYLQAAVLLITGLRTRSINLFMPYCDFIKYVLSKVEKMPSELAIYEGCGFSQDEPMGSVEAYGGSLMAANADMIISALEGDQGETILAYRGGLRYGSVTRVGSISGKNNRYPIDLYEVLAVDRQFRLKKLRFYVNGYYSSRNGFRIRLPKGFHFDPLSEAARVFTVVE